MSINGLLRNVSGISNTTQGAVDVLGRLLSGSYWSQLKPASYRGVAFGVLEASAQMGRRNALHEYAYRDTPWIEDMGRSARRITVTGFLIGDDIIARRDQLIAAIEKKGDGELAHPTLGKRKVAVMSWSTNERWDQGRVFEFTLSCIEQGARMFPQAGSRGGATVTAAGAQSKLQAAKAFVNRTVTALRAGANAVNEAVRQASDWSKVALQASRDATALVNLAATLPGEFGRLLGQVSGIKAGQVPAAAIGALTASDLKGVAAKSRTSVETAAATLATASQSLTATTGESFATAAQDLARAVRLAAPTPGDALRALAAMLGWAPANSAAGAAATVQAQTVLLFRRAVAVEMAQAAAGYEPASQGDAVAVRDLVAAALDAQLTAAGDAGDDEVFAELRTLRAEIVADLNRRGAAAPELRAVITPSSMPALALAQRLYGDAGRSDELVRRARPRHPAFMPTSFQALAQ